MYFKKKKKEEKKSKGKDAPRGALVPCWCWAVGSLSARKRLSCEWLSAAFH